MRIDAARTEAWPLLSYGFRPFFFGGAIWAVAAMVLWIGMITGNLDLAPGLPPVSWHVHEFLFGYVGAIVAGFLLTAVPNWTGRPPLRGLPLLALLALWIAGRCAFLLSGWTGYAAAAFIDALFLPALALLILREVRAAENKGNVRIGILVFVLALANILFHTEMIVYGQAAFATRGSISLTILLIMLIGGRIVPNFTRNWLAGKGNHRLPAQMDRFDYAALATGAVALALWTFRPAAPLTCLFLLAAGALHTVRLGRWSGWRTLREPLVFILHAGYAFIPLGFALVGLSLIWPDVLSPSVALHAWTTGAMGVMTLAVMTRATRGHSGRPLTAPPSTQLIYLCVVAAVIFRLTELVFPDAALTLYALSAIAWIAAFAGFLIIYSPMLLFSRS
ncbi:NnrS family protein [Parvibaculum sp.]|uniref:NnrS family protein n=1 Tax=Parvibaculum sp. TaxID=2024848 RepID=UPI003BAB472C